MIHLVMALYDRNGTYAKIAGACIASVFANTSQPVTVHLLHDHTLTAANKERLAALARGWNQTICCYDVTQMAMSRLAACGAKLVSRFSPASLYRLLAAEVLPVSVRRAVYLDADIICHMDIAELLAAFDDRSKVLAAVTEESDDIYNGAVGAAGTVAWEDYFNSGVLVMDMEALRERPRLLEDGMAFLARYDNYTLPDQDILNHFYAGRCQHLPRRFNNSVKYAYINERELQPAIYHYAGRNYTIDPAENLYMRLFFQYFAATPWADAAFWTAYLGRCADYHRRREARLLSEAARLRGRRRIFLVHPESADYIRQQYATQPDDQLLIMRDGHIDLTAAQLAGSILIVCLIMYDDLEKLLTGAGLTAGEDFIDGRDILFADMRAVRGGLIRAACMDYRAERERQLLLLV